MFCGLVLFVLPASWAPCPGLRLRHCWPRGRPRAPLAASGQRADSSADMEDDADGGVGAVSGGTWTPSTAAGQDVHTHRGGVEEAGGAALLTWDTVGRVNWEVIFLIGGGFALSKGFEVGLGLGLLQRSARSLTLLPPVQECGALSMISDRIIHSGVTSLVTMTVIVCLIATVMTNLISNVAAANILLPILACAGPRHGHPAIVVLAPVAICTSLAFLLPVGTPPNAIIMANGNVTVTTMIKVSRHLRRPVVALTLRTLTSLRRCAFLRWDRSA